MKYALLILVFSSAFAAAAGPNAFTPQVSAPNPGEYYNSGSFKRNLNSPATAAALGSQPDDWSTSQHYETVLVTQSAIPVPGGVDPRDHTIEISKLHEDEAPTARAPVLALDGLGRDEKLFDAKRILELGALGMDAEKANLLPGYIYNEQQNGSNQDYQYFKDKLDNVKAQRNDQAAEFRDKAGWAARGLNKMTRDSYLDDVQGPVIGASALPNGIPLGPDTARQQEIYDHKVDRVIDSLSPATSDFLRELGISSRDYAEGVVNGDFDTDEGRQAFFGRYAEAGPNSGNGAGGSKALAEAGKAYFEELKERLDAMPDPDPDAQSQRDGSGRGVSADKTRPPQSFVMDDDGKSRPDKFEETEKRALLSFVEDWWSHTTGKKVDPAALAPRGADRSGQKLSPGSERRRTIFDIAGETYRRNKQS